MAQQRLYPAKMAKFDLRSSGYDETRRMLLWILVVTKAKVDATETLTSQNLIPGGFGQSRTPLAPVIFAYCPIRMQSMMW